MSIKKLLIVAGALALAGCNNPQALCGLSHDDEAVNAEVYACDEFPIVEEPQVEPAGDVGS